MKRFLRVSLVLGALHLVASVAWAAECNTEVLNNHPEQSTEMPSLPSFEAGQLPEVKLPEKAFSTLDKMMALGVTRETAQLQLAVQEFLHENRDKISNPEHLKVLERVASEKIDPKTDPQVKSYRQLLDRIEADSAVLRRVTTEENYSLASDNQLMISDVLNQGNKKTNFF